MRDDPRAALGRLSRDDPRVIVVGAGIAGLVASWELKRAGFAVRVLEQAEFVGGRMSTVHLDAGSFDRGAGTLADSYPVLGPLVRTLGLSDSLHEFNQAAGIVQHGRIASLPTKPGLGAFFRSGLLGPSEIRWHRLLTTGARDLLRSRRLPFDDYTRWRSFDRETAEEWGERNLGRALLESFISPGMSSVFLQDPRQTSSALLLWFVAWMRGASKPMTLEGGVGVLPEALAERVGVERGVAVEQVEERGDEVRIRTSGGRDLRADWVVLATPAGVAKRIYTTASDFERSVLATSYRPGLVIGLQTSRSWRYALAPNDLVLYRRGESPLSHYVIQESTRCRRIRAGEEILKVVVDGDDAERLLPEPDDAVVRELCGRLEPIFPGVSTCLSDARVVRHAAGMPSFEPGRAAQVARYRTRLERAPKRVFLAGDYLSFLSVDSAAGTGQTAARAIVERQRRPGAPVVDSVSPRRRA